MNLQMQLATAAACGLLALALFPVSAAQARSHDGVGSAGPPSIPQAVALDRETEQMYQYVSRSLVEVHLSRDVTKMLPPPLRKKFVEWEEQWVTSHHFRPMRPRPFAGGGPSITIRPDLNRRHEAESRRKDAERWFRHLQKRPIGQLFLLQRFLVMKLHAFGNPHLMPILQAVHLRIESYHDGLRNRVYGLVTGHHGHVLVLSVLGVGSAKRGVAVTTPEGHTYRAAVLGVDYHRDMTELQLPAQAQVPGISLAPHWPRQAEMVLAINGGSPGIKWTHLCGQMRWSHRHRSRNRRADSRYVHHHGGGRQRITSFFQMVNLPRFFIDVKGQLAAVSSNSMAMVMGGKFSVLRQFVETGFVAYPRFGIKYKLLSPQSKWRRKYPGIGSSAAALVQKVFPHSPAQRSGVKPHDIILTIDRMPIDQLGRILKAARRHPDDIPITVLRRGRRLNLTINLLPPHGPPPGRPALVQPHG
jgi:hypothetical protein